MDNEMIIKMLEDMLKAIKETIRLEKKVIDVYIDLDNCVFNTIKCITDLYNEDFQYYENFVKLEWTDIMTWNFEELSLAEKGYIDTYFNQKRFFDRIEYMDNAEVVLKKLVSDNKISICFVSSGLYPNLIIKEQWVKKYYPTAKFIGVDIRKYKNKAHVNMENGIFIDDSFENLIASNAKYKICFGEKYEWNAEWKDSWGCRCYNWNEVYNMIYRVLSES